MLPFLHSGLYVPIICHFCFNCCRFFPILGLLLQFYYLYHHPAAYCNLQLVPRMIENNECCNRDLKICSTLFSCFFCFFFYSLNWRFALFYFISFCFMLVLFFSSYFLILLSFYLFFLFHSSLWNH